RRPAVDERGRGERREDAQAEARARRPRHARLDRRRLRTHGRGMSLASIQVEEALLILKIAFLVLLYLFIWRIVRTASRDLRLPQESFVLAPQQAAGLGIGARVQTGKLVVMRSPSLEEGRVLALDSSSLSVGRGTQNGVAIPDDSYASAEH